MLDFISLTKERDVQLQEQTRKELQLLLDVIHTGWPNYQNEVPIPLRPYWDSKSELGVSDGIIYKGMRIVVPPSLHHTQLSPWYCKVKTACSGSALLANNEPTDRRGSEKLHYMYRVPK